MSSLPILPADAARHEQAFQSLPEFVKEASVADRGWDTKEVWREAFDRRTVPTADNAVLIALTASFCAVYPVRSQDRNLKGNFIEAMMQRLEWCTPYVYGARIGHIDKASTPRSTDKWFASFISKTNRYYQRLGKRDEAARKTEEGEARQLLSKHAPAQQAATAEHYHELDELVVNPRHLCMPRVGPTFLVPQGNMTTGLPIIQAVAPPEVAPAPEEESPSSKKVRLLADRSRAARRPLAGCLRTARGLLADRPRAACVPFLFAVFTCPRARVLTTCFAELHQEAEVVQDERTLARPWIPRAILVEEGILEDRELRLWTDADLCGGHRPPYLEVSHRTRQYRSLREEWAGGHRQRHHSDMVHRVQHQPAARPGQHGCALPRIDHKRPPLRQKERRVVRASPPRLQLGWVTPALCA